VLNEGYEPSEELAKELRDYVRKRIAPYKAPKEIEFVDALPKTVTGKIMRKLLKKQEETRTEEEKPKTHVYTF
jgi:acetyl-CoA synthetase/medium-chain acyl-CoA synthetase